MAKTPKFAADDAFVFYKILELEQKSKKMDKLVGKLIVVRRP